MRVTGGTTQAMKNNPGDLEILRTIFDQYLTTFIDESEKTESRRKVYIPIDVAAMAEQLNMSKHILFGRLYYHLDQKYRYTDSNGAETHLFAMKVGDDKHCIHFPYLSAILAERVREFRRYALTLTISFISLVLSIIALVIKH